jgi:hypothetical protein
MPIKQALGSASVCLRMLLSAGLLTVVAAGRGTPAAAGRGTDMAADPGAPLAAAAGTKPSSVNEYGRLTIQSSKSSTIDEKGSGWGSFNCSVAIELTLSGTLVSSHYTAYLEGGSISGTATAHIHYASTATAYFSGTITLDGGTGSHAHASGTASFSGTINRTSYAMNTHITGRLRL